MTDDQNNKLNEIIDKLYKISEALNQTSEALKRGWVVTYVPPQQLVQIIGMLTPMAEDIRQIRQHLADTGQAKTSPDCAQREV